MAVVKPFMYIRPATDKAARVTALPYDVYNEKEACQAVKGNPLSFLSIDRTETQFGDDVGTHDSRVYDRARELLDCQIEGGAYVTDPEEDYYPYELTMEERGQTNTVVCCSIDDYVNGMVKKHENTREDKELDHIRHVDAANAHTGPIFSVYRQGQEPKALATQVKEEALLYDSVLEDAVHHRMQMIGVRSMAEATEAALAAIPGTYTADGHHRAASAMKVRPERREENLDYTGKEPFNYFLIILFPDEELKILPYNRAVKDLNRLRQEDFLAVVVERFNVAAQGDPGCGEPGADAFQSGEKGIFGMFLGGRWYCLRVRPEFQNSDPVKGLDVSILRDQLLGPVLGVGDPRTNKRIDFIGGIRGLKELERRMPEDMEAAFFMYPISIEELLAVVDAGLPMSPKPTWFKPKLRSGLPIHRLRQDTRTHFGGCVRERRGRNLGGGGLRSGRD